MKEEIPPFENDAFSILKNAGLQSKKYYHTYCGTAHLFLSLFAFLSKNKETERYKGTYEKLKGILNAGGITGPKFEENFLLISPPGTKPEDENEKFTIQADTEFQKFSNTTTIRAKKEKRSLCVEDIIAELFAEKSFSLFSIFSMITGSDQESEKIYNEIVQAFKNVTKKIETDLDKIPELTNLNLYVQEHPQTVIDAEKVINQIELSLCSRTNANALLVGPAGTGKTTYVYELAQRINRGKIANGLKDKIIYQLDPTTLIAGTRFRGDFEEKLNNIIKLTKANPNTILFVDEAHSLISLGDQEGANAAGNIFKPYLSKGEIQMIIATTNDEFTKYLQPEKAFVRRFAKILIEEPTKEATKTILKGLIPVEEKFFDKTMKEELVEKIVNLAEKYTLDQANPAKALAMLDTAFAYSKVFKEENKEVEIDDIIEAIKLKYNIYVSDTKLEDTKKELNSFILGQEEPLKQFCKDLSMVDKGLVDPERPLLSLILAGPSGVGKTESAKIIAEKYFGSREKNLVKINMGEYSSEMDVSKLTGSSAGYVGYDDETALIKGIRQYPNSVVLFDEIEKANPAVMKVLLNILDCGEMTDNKGNRVSFRNAIIIFTTNLGYSLHFAEEKGLGFLKEKGSALDIQKSIEKHFSPEFLGRIDDIIIYNNLSNDTAEQLIERNRKFYCDNAEVDLKLTKKDIEEIIVSSRISQIGARGLKKAVKDQLAKIMERDKEKSLSEHSNHSEKTKKIKKERKTNGK